MRCGVRGELRQSGGDMSMSRQGQSGTISSATRTETDCAATRRGCVHATCGQKTRAQRIPQQGATTCAVGRVICVQ